MILAIAKYWILKIGSCVYFRIYTTPFFSIYSYSLLFEGVMDSAVAPLASSWQIFYMQFNVQTCAIPMGTNEKRMAQFWQILLCAQTYWSCSNNIRVCPVNICINVMPNNVLWKRLGEGRRGGGVITFTLWLLLIFIIPSLYCNKNLTASSPGWSRHILKHRYKSHGPSPPLSTPMAYG